MALRICEALRGAGVEVWLDQEGGLVGGDAWDRKIREQIGSCALFIPIVSANTQARHEGYFRLEWKLAEDRSHLIAKGKPFIVPVSVDGTTERGALVPDAFLAVQWTRIGSADSLPAFCERVKRLLGREVAGATSGSATRPVDQAQDKQAPGPSRAPRTEVLSPAAIVTKPNLATALQPALERAFDPAAPATTTEFVPLRPRWRRALPVTSAVLVTALVAGLVAWRRWPAAAPAPVTRFTYRLPDGQTFKPSGRSIIAVSPDGRRFVYGTTTAFHLRSLEEIEAGGIRARVDAFDGDAFGREPGLRRCQTLVVCGPPARRV